MGNSVTLFIRLKSFCCFFVSEIKRETVFRTFAKATAFLLCLVLLTLSGVQKAKAAFTVTPASVTLITKAAWKATGNIVFTEGAANDFAQNVSGTLTLTIPTGFIFNTAGIGVTFSGPNISAASFGSATSTQIIINVTTNNAAQALTDILTVTGVQVEASAYSPIATTANITYAFTTVSALSGNAASLSQKVPTIGAPTITGTVFFQGQSITISTFTVTTSTDFDPTNVFTAELSDAAGSFASPAVVGTRAATTGGAVSPAVIPAGTPLGGPGYRIRIVSSLPVITGTQNVSALSVVTPAITTGAVATSFCQGSSVSVPYTINTSSFSAGNIFTAELSDLGGATWSGNYIGTLASTASGTVTATIPSGTPTGTYRIRVLSSAPAVTGAANSSGNLTLNVPSITTGVVTATFCEGVTLSVPYTVCGGWTGGNIFTAQISDNTGSYASPVNIGTLASTSSGTVTATIPVGTLPTGSGYRIRVISSTPAVTGSDNSNGSLTLNPIIITTGTVSTPFCQGAAVSVPYTVCGGWIGGNIFTAQLSDNTGSFAAPVNIGTLASTTSGTIAATIPGGTAAGSAYKIRVVSSTPVVTGSDNSNGSLICVVSGGISTGTVNASLCVGCVTDVPYYVCGVWTAGNIFTAQLSDNTGSFAAPVNVGTLLSTTSGTISATIPAGTSPLGSGYRIRVISSTPAVTGTANSNGVISMMTPPTITSFAPASGPVGTTVTITGTNFNTTPSNNIVYFGATQGTVTGGVGSTQLTVTVPYGANYQYISVTNNANSLTANSSSPFVVTFTCSSGTFAAGPAPTTGNSPAFPAIGDFDGDGKADLAVTDQNSPYNISVFLNTSPAQGTISFAAKADFAAANFPWGIATGDLDGDGKLDIITASNGGAGPCSVFRNLSSGVGNINFSRVLDLTIAQNNAVAVGDLDGDGLLDIAATNMTGTTLYVFRNKSTPGNMAFAASQTYATGANPWGVTIGDMDGDKKPEIVVANKAGNTISVFQNASTCGIINASSFVAQGPFVTGNGPECVALGDIDNDGRSDIVVTDNTSNPTNTFSVLRNSSTGPGVFTFDPKVDVTIATGGLYLPFGIAVGDLSGDGLPDVEAVCQVTNTAYTFTNSSVSPTITLTLTTTNATGTAPYGIALGDFDNDAGLDIAASCYNVNSISTFHNSCVVLPLTLLSFTASADNNTVQCLWSTASETNNDYFSVEKSFDGNKFEVIGKVKGSGNSTVERDYIYTDRYPYRGINYYRLKQVDYNGSFSYSKIVSVINSGGAEGMNIYPNPPSAGQNIHLNLASSSGKKILVVIYDFTGRTIFSKVILQSDSGDFIIATDPEDKLSPGVYFITATSDDQLYNRKLVIK